MERTEVTEYPPSLASELEDIQPVRNAAFFEAHSAAASMARRRQMEDSEKSRKMQRKLCSGHGDHDPNSMYPTPTQQKIAYTFTYARM